MIKIEKELAPASIQKAKAKYALLNNPKYLGDVAGYNDGTKKFKFTTAYRSAAVKAALMRSQYGKCCFSEAKFTNDDAHVEHFRPKGMVESKANGSKSYPGYYWLAYDWDNLFLCKSTTNSSAKLNYFPLSGAVQRNRNHLDANLEDAVLIDPSKEDPRDFIRFVNEEITGVDERGRKNIEILGLRNPQLDEARRIQYRRLVEARDAVELFIANGISIDEPAVAALITSLRESVRPNATFSSMAIDLLTGWHLLE